MKHMIALALLACLACNERVAEKEEPAAQKGQALTSATEVALVGGVTTDAAVVGFRTAAAGSVQVKYATNPNLNNATTTSAVSTQASSDFTGSVALPGLSAGTNYWYRLVVDGSEQNPGFVQKFQTLPSSGECVIAVFADVANNDRATAVYAKAKDDGAMLALQIGDMDHRNPSSLAASRTMHRETRDPSTNHGSKFAQQTLAQMGVAHVWDDHDYCDNDEDKDCPTKATALQAYDEYWPGYSRPAPADGIWHKFTCSDAEVFMLDTRFQRDPNSQTDDSGKSMLGAAQKAWLKAGLKDSTAAWKVVVSSVTANTSARPNSDDHWMGGFSTEAAEMAAWITGEGITGVVMVSADLHTGGAVDDGSNNGWGVPELGVAHTNLAGGNGNQLGTWSEGVTAGTNGRYGYGLLTVNSGSLKLEAKAKNGTVRHDLTL